MFSQIIFDPTFHNFDNMTDDQIDTMLWGEEKPANKGKYADLKNAHTIAQGKKSRVLTGI